MSHSLLSPDEIAMRSRKRQAAGAVLAVGALATLATALATGALAAQAPPARTYVLSLDDAIRMATGESESVLVAEAGRMRAVGEEEVARSGLFPQLSGTAQYVRTLRSQFSAFNFSSSGGGSSSALQDLPFGRPNQYTLGLALSQLVWDGGQTRSFARAAAARRRSADLDATSARAQTVLDVTSAYFDAQLADSLVSIARSTLDQADEVLRQTTAAKEQGERSEYDLLRARVARDNQRPGLVQRQTSRDLAYARLKQLLGLSPEDAVQLATGVAAPQPRFAKAADASPPARVPVRQAGETVRADLAQLDAARAERMPTIAVSSSYAPVAYPASGLPSPHDFLINWTVGLSLSVPILTGGRLQGDETVARANVAADRARLRQVEKAAALDAQDAAAALAQAEATLAGNAATAEEAERAYSIALLRFREGLATQVDLSDARLQRELAATNRAQALRDVQVARARLALLSDLPLAAGGAAAAAPSTTTPGQTAASRSTATTLAAPSLQGTGLVQPAATPSGGPP